MRLISARRAKYLRKKGRFVYWNSDWYSWVYVKQQGGTE